MIKEGEAMNKFYERIKELRNLKRLSQKDFADKFSLTQQAVAKWEKNQASPNPDMLVKLADFFDVSTDYLLGRTDDTTFFAKPNPENTNVNRLHTLMEEKEVSTEELADLLNIPKYDIKRFELGLDYPNAQQLKVLADYFYVPIEYITGSSDAAVSSVQKLHNESVESQPNKNKPKNSNILQLDDEELEFITPTLDSFRKFRKKYNH